MSYVNVYLGGNVISVVSDTQITNSDGTVSREEMKKFLVTDQKVLIATTGNADVAKIMFEFFDHQELNFSEVVTKVTDFFDEIHDVKDNEGGKILQRVIVAGFENGMARATSLGLGMNQNSNKTNYESGTIIHLTPKDYNFNIYEYSKRLKSYKLNDVVALQKKALLRVSRHSKQVNDTIDEDLIIYDI